MDISMPNSKIDPSEFIQMMILSTYMIYFSLIFSLTLKGCVDPPP